MSQEQQGPLSWSYSEQLYWLLLVREGERGTDVHNTVQLRCLVILESELYVLHVEIAHAHASTNISV